MSALLAAEDSDNDWLPNPGLCPSWCDGDAAHAVPLAEGCGWADSQQHSASGYDVGLPEILYAGRPCREFGGGWDTHVEQRPLGRDGGYWGPAFIHAVFREPDNRKRATLQLTSGEARVLARQLIALADRLDL